MPQSKMTDYILMPSLYSGDLGHRPESLFDNLIWGIDEVCKFTAYKKGTIYNLVSSGDIPYRKRGKRLFFIPIEIFKWIKGELK